MGHPICVASPSEMNEIAAIMDKGFEADPTVNWVLTERDFMTSHRKFVEVCARPAFNVGGVHVFTDFSGASIWYPPGVGLDEAELARVFENLDRQDRIASFFSLLDACVKFRPEKPYWELELLAVDPEQQRQGRGAKLLEYGLQNCDGEHALVYLESSNPANLSFYHRHGFELLAEVQLPGTPKRFPMLRAGG
ncbi:GNAT family N-acetyltransferase [Halomonas sp. TRM85114]|uniref:GNAT family N-acetyltransferase n=1 Tax=Halomonas jincaotanensis TaxID=2810616 RepID=UPI001BD54993|nr:GNAT family N-acetyltransferase [Halomonas jincaotanensis]MBS9402532.1 GNAT family N-acetyltransferase [Halomonas jincaotanensis]